MIALVMYRNPAEEFLWTYVYPWLAIGLIALVIVGIICWLFGAFTEWLWALIRRKKK